MGFACLPVYLTSILIWFYVSAEEVQQVTLIETGDTWAGLDSPSLQESQWTAELKASTTSISSVLCKECIRFILSKSKITRKDWKTERY